MAACKQAINREDRVSEKEVMRYKCIGREKNGLDVPHVLKNSVFPSRGLHAAVCFPFDDCRRSAVLYGAGSRTEHPPGQHRRLEAHLPEPGRDRLLQLHREGVLEWSFGSCSVVAEIHPPHSHTRS